jgi:hypothetical protein
VQAVALSHHELSATDPCGRVNRGGCPGPGVHGSVSELAAQLAAHRAAAHAYVCVRASVRVC